jgi:predicted phage-related endonuclease
MKIDDLFNSIDKDLDNIQYNEDFVEKTKDEWHQQRLGKLTASRFEDLVTRDKSGKKPGVAAMKYVYEKVAELLTNAPHIVTSQAMDWGNEMEAFARTKYTEITKNEVTQAGFFEYTEMSGGSPDGLVDEDGIIEIKCPFNPANHIETIITNEVPVKYIYQIQGNLMVTDRKWCDYISYDPRVQEPSLQIFIMRVHRDEEIINEIKERIEEISQLVKDLYEKLK